MFKEINVYELNDNVFKLFAKDWAIINVDCGHKVNSMTASWLQIGHLWQEYVVSVYVRKQRYTYEFIDQANTFSISFFDDQYRKELVYLGQYSGRDVDKLAQCHFTCSKDGEIPYIDQSKMTLICEKLYHYDLDEKHFDEQKIVDMHYPEKDFHRVYVARIKKILVKGE